MRIATCLALLVFFVPAVATGDGEPAREDGARLRKLLSAYDRTGGGNTIPLEEEILRLRAKGNGQGLTAALRHPRFGPLAVWALADVEVAGRDALVAEAAARWPRTVQIESAWVVAGSPGAAIRAWVAELAAGGLSTSEQRHVRVAQVRLKDPAARKDLRRALRSESADVVAEALLLAGDARATDLLPDVVTQAASSTRLKAALTSRWKHRVRTESKDGMSSTTRTLPRRLRTLGAVALEAASRMVACDAPGYVAWWYDPESPPRFDADRDGLALLRAYARAGRRGAAAKAVPVNAAVWSAKLRLKQDAVKARAGIQLRLRAAEFDADGYLLEFEETRRTTDGEDHCRRSVLVSPKGAVTSIQTSRSPRIPSAGR